MILVCFLTPVALGGCQYQVKETYQAKEVEAASWTDEEVTAEDRSGLNFGDATGEAKATSVNEGTYSQLLHLEDRNFVDANSAPVKQAESRSKPMLIQKVSMELRVDNLQHSRQQLDSILQLNQGYLAHERYEEEVGQKGFQMIVRVPSDKLEQFLRGSKGMEGELRSFGRNSEDVKAQYIDQETRLSTKRKVLERYEAILGRAGKISEVLEAEREIRNLIEEIEATEGRLKYLREQSSYATVSMDLFEWVESEPLTAQVGFGDKVILAFQSGGKSVLAVVLFFIQIWPFMLLIPVFILAWRKRRHSLKASV